MENPRLRGSRNSSPDTFRNLGWETSRASCPDPRSLAKETAFVPAIIEIKAQHSNKIFDVISSLKAVKFQLQKQARYLFSSFEWQGSVIAIAGVHKYVIG